MALNRLEPNESGCIFKSRICGGLCLLRQAEGSFISVDEHSSPGFHFAIHPN